MTAQCTRAELNKSGKWLSVHCIYVLARLRRGKLRWFHDDNSEEPYLPTVRAIHFWKIPAKSGFPDENSSKNLLVRIEEGEP